MKLHKLAVTESNGMSYMIPHAVSYPYMITAIIDVANGLLYSAFSILRHVESLRFTT